MKCYKVIRTENGLEAIVRDCPVPVANELIHLLGFLPYDPEEVAKYRVLVSV